MRDTIYLVVNLNGVQRMAHDTDCLLHNGEYLLPVAVHVSNSHFSRVLPAHTLNIPDDDLLTPAAVEIIATPIPQQEIA